MQVRKNPGVHLVVIIFTMALCCSLAFGGEIPVDSYCELHVKSLHELASNLRDLIATFNQYQDDQQAFQQAEAMQKNRFEAALSSLYASYGTTEQDYVLYMGGHREAVDAYLSDHPEVREAIDEVMSQVRSLEEEYEALRRP